MKATKANHHRIKNPQPASAAWMFQKKPSSGNFSDSISAAKENDAQVNKKKFKKG